jgi:Protein of unknown function DUF262
MKGQNDSTPTATAYTIEDLLRYVQSGRVRIPNFQRVFRWQATDVARLLESIYLGYPIGSLLLWERPAPAIEVTLGALTINAPQTENALWVVDGQQRITSLANTLIDQQNADKRFAWGFDLRTEKFVPPTKNAEEFVIPLPTIVNLQKLFRWFSDHPNVADRMDTATALARTIREYKIPAYLVQSADEEVLRNIFDRMNNFGKRLSRAEVFHSLHGDADSQDINFRRIAEQIEAKLGFGRIDEDTLLAAILARRGANHTRDIRNEFSADSTGEFDETEAQGYANGAQALESAISFLQTEAHVPHFGFLPYRYLLVILTRFFAHFPQPQTRHLELLRRWVWRAAVLGPEAMKGWTQTQRKFLARIEPGKEEQSVQSMLLLMEPLIAKRRLLIDEASTPAAFRTTSASSRVLACALWALKPRRATGDRTAYSLSELSITLEGQATPKRAVIQLMSALINSEIGIAISLDEDQADFLHAVEQNANDQPEWLASHALSLEASDAMQREDVNAFQSARSKALKQLVTDFIARNAGWNHEDTPPLDSLFIDEDVEEEIGETADLGN